MRTALALCLLGLTIILAPARVHADTKSADTALRTITVDANGAETRQKYGVIPGAVLLPHYADYDVAKELPRDRAAKLVFYCANEKCMASHKAAEHAAEAGYSDVSILPAGIMGWKGAGQPTGPSGS